MYQKQWQRSIFRLSLALGLLLATCGLPSPASAGAPALTRQLPRQAITAPHSSAELAVIETLDFTAIAAGRFYTCALTTSGGVKCWGDNVYGQLGDGTKIQRNTPVDVVGLTTGVTAIATGGYYTCALTDNGGVKCWGYNWAGQLGDGTKIDRSTPVDVVGLSSGVTVITTGWSHTCALNEGDGMKCWGYNWAGQLGDGTTSQRSTPVDVIGLSSDVTAIAAGGSHTCALTANGGAKCWGYNEYGQLGDGTLDQRNTPVDVIGLSSGVTAITTGGYHTCTLISGGGMKCWGYNLFGQLGDGTWTGSNIPVEVIGLTGDILTITAGYYHTCALTAGGGVKCWGSNGSGQLGDGTTDQRSTPLDVVGLTSGVMFIAGGESHTCASDTGGGMKCWGYDGYGQLGDGITTQRSTPVDVGELMSNATVMAAGSGHTCALTEIGGLKCWGGNESGQLGDGTTIQRSTPVDVAGLTSGVTIIVAGGFHTCALTDSGGVKCWGANWAGQLGDGTTTPHNTPVDVIGLTSGVTTITAGYYHTCALTVGGGVKCWGYNWAGQLGDGTTDERSTPVDVIGLSSGVTALTAGRLHTCALTTVGGMKCWGYNASGQLGDGTTTDSYTPVDVLGLSSGVSAITTGFYHTCTLTVSSGMKCWGDNGWGQLGDGTTDQRGTPVDVVGLVSGVTAITAGSYHTCGLIAGSGLKCWGYNGQGQLGDGTWDQRNTPADVDGLTSGVAVIAAGGSTTCGLVGNGRLKCWGSDSIGQLGIGTIIMHLTPVEVIETLAPLVTINYPNGQPGSYFTITGWNFPPDTLAIFYINVQFYKAVSVNPTGSFIFFLDTAGCEPGGYTVLVSVNPSASTSFTLADEAPLRPQEGGGLTFRVPSGIGYDNFVYLPILRK